MSKITTKDLWAQSANVLPTATSDEVHPSDQNFIPPAAEIRLPSRGIVYPMESPLYLVETLQIKPVGAKEEDILSDTVLIRNATVLTVLMKSCITNRLVDPDKLLLGDRNAVMLQIRISAFGPQYTVKVTCPECFETKEHSFDLNKLKTKFLQTEPSAGKGTNLFDYVIPSGRTVTFRLLDGSMNNDLDKELDLVKKKTGRERNVTLRLRSQIVSISGVDSERLGAFIDNMSTLDTRALRKYMDSIAPGVDMVQDYPCTMCGKTNEVEIPLGSEFFWPS